MKNHHAFTLAEVLITLGIIGVVAAMTIPTLIANTNSSKFASQFKKTLSQLSQAALMAQSQWDANYGTLDGLKDEDSPATCDKDDDISKGNNTICGFYNATLSGVRFLDASGIAALSSNGKTYKVTGKGGLSDLESFTGYVGFLLADGSLVVTPDTLHDCTIEGQLQTSHMQTGGALANCIGWIDVNGAALPNKEVSCSKSDETTGLEVAVCSVSKDPKNMTDIFPVVFHDQVVEPATNAAKAILNGANKG